jgi:hypothetical protein
MSGSDVSQRITKSLVTFARPFRLGEMAEIFPAGKYNVETDEELLLGVSFPAYRRVAAVIQRVAEPSESTPQSIAISDPRQLDFALVRDQAESAQDPSSEDSSASPRVGLAPS